MTTPPLSPNEPARAAIPRPDRPSNPIRKALTWLLVLGALGFLAHALAPEISVVRSSMAAIGWPQVVLAMLVAIPMYAIKGCYHLNLLDRIAGERSSRRIGLPIYLQAQIVRYLPGKVWGIVYQSQRMSRTHRPSEVVIANLWQMATTNALAAGLVIGLLLAFRYSLAWLLLLVPVIGAVEWMHRHPAIESWMLKQLARFLPRLVPLANSRPLPSMPWKGTALLCSEWIFYFASFSIMLHGLADWPERLLLGTWYGGASILALAAFVVPAGIAVREAIFVAAPGLTGADAATLAVTATLARLVFLGAEIAAAVLSSAWTLGVRRDPA
ncbi:hypothetical protein [Lysobacter sp. CA196]|uniref:hypothetical protein n=1 Tax=Lysobacter sp. CA196 TaxID=3455606 RepID=UPI003F8D014E